MFFTFWHTTTNPKKEKKAVLGYAAVPIYRDGRYIKQDSSLPPTPPKRKKTKVPPNAPIPLRIIIDERVQLPIAAEFPNRYLDPGVDSQIRWLDGKRELFSFRTRLVSSVYSRDEQYTTFLRDRERVKVPCLYLYPYLHLHLYLCRNLYLYLFLHLHLYSYL